MPDERRIARLDKDKDGGDDGKQDDQHECGTDSRRRRKTVPRVRGHGQHQYHRRHLEQGRAREGRGAPIERRRPAFDPCVRRSNRWPLPTEARIRIFPRPMRRTRRGGWSPGGRRLPTPPLYSARRRLRAMRSSRGDGERNHIPRDKRGVDVAGKTVEGARREHVTEIARWMRPMTGEMSIRSTANA